MNESLNEDKMSNEGRIYFITENKKLLVGLGVLMILVASFTVLANGTVALAMVQTLVREIRRGTQSMPSSGNSCVTRLLMLSLAFSGVLVGGFLMPLSVNDFINNGQFNSANDLCVADIYIGYILGFSANLHKMSMAIDTYLLVRHPLVHRFLTAKTGYCLVTIAWTLPTLLVILWIPLQQGKPRKCYEIVHTFYDFDYSTLFSFIFGIIFLVILVGVWIIYFIVLREISNFLKRPSIKPDLRPNIKRSSAEVISDLSINLSAPEVVSGHGTNNRSRKTLNSNVKSLRSIGLILLSLTIGWSPIWILYFIYISGQVISSWLYVTFSWLMYLSYAVNPVLYCSNKHIQHSVKRLICKEKSNLILR